MTSPSPQAPTPYRAFISYCHRDQEIARWLHRALEAYRVPRTLVGRAGEYGAVTPRLGRIFRDEDELASAAELGPKLQGALDGSAALIVICSPKAAASFWVDKEIRYFRKTHPDRPVLAVIADGAPTSDRECFPESLRFGVRLDGELDREMAHEPLAPDLQKLDKDSVKLKLLAGLLGISYGDLAQRDIKRARRQMVFAGALATVIIVALTALSGVAFTYAQIAMHERNVARQQRQIAEHNAEEAERKAWLANVAAIEVRRQADVIGKGKGTKSCAKPSPSSTGV